MNYLNIFFNFLTNFKYFFINTYYLIINIFILIRLHIIKSDMLFIYSYYKNY